MSIRYWFPSDEEQNGALGVAITDEDAGFVVGTMKCFAGLALAGVLAANALAAQLPYAKAFQVDERNAPATLLVDETECIPRVLPTPPVSWAATAIFDDDSDFVPAPVVVALDDGQWTVTVPAPSRAITLAATEDDQYVGFLGTDEDGWLPPRPWPVAIVRAVLDDETYVGYLGTDDDGWLPPVLVAVVRANTIRDDGDFVAPASLAIENYEWPAVLLVAPAATFARAATDDGNFVALVATGLVDEDTGRWPQIGVSTFPLPQIFDDDSDFLALLMAFDGRMMSEPLYDGMLLAGLQFDGNVAIAVLLDGRITIYPA